MIKCNSERQDFLQSGNLPYMFNLSHGFRKNALYWVGLTENFRNTTFVMHKGEALHEIVQAAGNEADAVLLVPKIFQFPLVFLRMNLRAPPEGRETTSAYAHGAPYKMNSVSSALFGFFAIPNSNSELNPIQIYPCNNVSRNGSFTGSLLRKIDSSSLRSKQPFKASTIAALSRS